jgi:hypothetical protein
MIWRRLEIEGTLPDAADFEDDGDRCASMLCQGFGIDFKLLDDKALAGHAELTIVTTRRFPPHSLWVQMTYVEK